MVSTSHHTQTDGLAQMLSRLLYNGISIGFHVLFTHDHDSFNMKVRIDSQVEKSVLHLRRDQ